MYWRKYRYSWYALAFSCSRCLRLQNALTFDAKNTGLDRNTLSICVSLIENGVNPDALAVCIDIKSNDVLFRLTLLFRR